MFRKKGALDVVGDQIEVAKDQLEEIYNDIKPHGGDYCFNKTDKDNDLGNESADSMEEACCFSFCSKKRKACVDS